MYLVLCIQALRISRPLYSGHHLHHPALLRPGNTSLTCEHSWRCRQENISTKNIFRQPDGFQKDIFLWSRWKCWFSTDISLRIEHEKVSTKLSHVLFRFLYCDSLGIQVCSFSFFVQPHWTLYKNEQNNNSFLHEAHPLPHWYYGHFHQSWHSTIEGVLFKMLDIMEFSPINDWILYPWFFLCECTTLLFHQLPIIWVRYLVTWFLLFLFVCIRIHIYWWICIFRLRSLHPRDVIVTQSF